MKNSIKFLPIFLTTLLVSLFSCQEEDSTLSSLEGTVSFGGISLEFAPIGTSGNRMEGISPWIHIFPNSAKIVFTNKVTKEEFSLEYNPNDFSVPYTIQLPFGEYQFYSKIEAGIFSDFLPFEAKGEFNLDSQSLEISLKGKTDYGLISVKNEFLEEATVSDGTIEANFTICNNGSHFYKYVKGGTSTTLKIIESTFGGTIIKKINVGANVHYNFVLKRGEGTANIIGLSIDPFELVDEEIIIGSSVFFDENGTIKCPLASPGDKGEVNGKVYEAVDRALLIQRRDEGADLTCLCTSLVTDMSRIFEGFYTFNQPIGNWDLSNVTTMELMFSSATNFNQPIDNWDISSVKNMSRLFFFAESFDQPLANWNVGNVTDMRRMFYGAMVFSHPISNWDVSNVTNISGMFGSTDAFNQPIGNWDVSNVTDMSGMFGAAAAFGQNLKNWDVSKVTNMQGMFYKTGPGIGIENWDVRNVENMDRMFLDGSIESDLSSWCVEKITSEPEDFVTWITQSGKLPVWGTCPD